MRIQWAIHNAGAGDTMYCHGMTCLLMLMLSVICRVLARAGVHASCLMRRRIQFQGVDNHAAACCFVEASVSFNNILPMYHMCIVCIV